MHLSGTPSTNTSRSASKASGSGSHRRTSATAATLLEGTPAPRPAAAVGGMDPKRASLLARGKGLGLDVGAMGRMPIDALAAAVQEGRLRLEQMLAQRYADFQATIDLARSFGVDEPGFDPIENIEECDDATLNEEMRAVLVSQLQALARAKQAGYIVPGR